MSCKILKMEPKQMVGYNFFSGEKINCWICESVLLSRQTENDTFFFASPASDVAKVVVELELSRDPEEIV